jgi:ABC-2 type transport system ATP-binding protein
MAGAGAGTGTPRHGRAGGAPGPDWAAVAEPVVRAEGLTKRFGDLVALDHVDLEVEAGEVLGYLGPNGAGKSTTIRLLLDVIRPSAGRSSVLGGSGADPAVRRRIGYLPAELHLPADYTAADLVGWFGALRGPGGRERADELYGRFEVDPGRRLGDLSTGNRRKVAIVQAFMHRPDLLILDEPTSGLDPLLQDQFHQLVREERDRGATVFLSSHVLPEVEALADRVGVLRAGRLVEVTSLDDLRARSVQRLDLHLEGPAPDDLFRGVPGVVGRAVEGDVVHLTVEGSMDAVVKAAATVAVARIVSHETDLEDLFRSLYRDESGTGDEGTP